MAQIIPVKLVHSSRVSTELPGLLEGGLNMFVSSPRNCLSISYSPPILEHVGVRIGLLLTYRRHVILLLKKMELRTILGGMEDQETIGCKNRAKRSSEFNKNNRGVRKKGFRILLKCDLYAYIL